MVSPVIPVAWDHSAKGDPNLIGSFSDWLGRFPRGPVGPARGHNRDTRPRSYSPGSPYRTPVTVIPNPSATAARRTR